MRKVLSGFGFLGGASILSQLLGLVGLVYITHRTTVAQVGAYSLCAAIVSYFALSVNFGVTMLAIRDCVRQPERRRDVLGETLLLQTGLSVGALTIVLLATPVLAPNHLVEKLLPIVALRLVIDAVSFDWALQAQERFKLLAGVRLAGQMFYAAAILALVTQGEAAIETFAWANLAGFALTSIATHFCIGRRAWSVGAARPRFLMQRLRRSVPLGAVLAIATVYFSLDSIMLGYFSSAKEVGLYAAAAKFPSQLIGLSIVWASSIYPHAAELAIRDPRQLAEQVGRAAVIAAGVGVPLVVITAAVGPQLLATFFGEAYREAGAAFAVLTMAGVAVLISTSFSTVLIAAHNERGVVLSTAAGAIANLLLNLVLIPRLHSLGAAIDTLIAEVVVLAMNARLFARRVAEPNVAWRTVGAIGMAASASLAVPLLWQGPWILLTGFILLAYTAAAGIIFLVVRATTSDRLAS